MIFFYKKEKFKKKRKNIFSLIIFFFFIIQFIYGHNVFYNLIDARNKSVLYIYIYEFVEINISLNLLIPYVLVYSSFKKKNQEFLI